MMNIRVTLPCTDVLRDEGHVMASQRSVGADPALVAELGGSGDSSCDVEGAVSLRALPGTLAHVRELRVNSLAYR